MRDFITKFFSLLDHEDKKGFMQFLGLLLISGVLSTLSIGTVIPVIHLLMDPDQVHQFSWLQGYSYQQVLLAACGLLIVAYWIKNIMAFWVFAKQTRFLLNMVAKIRQRLFDNYMKQPFVWHLKRNTPTLIRNINNETIMFTNNVMRPMGNLLTEGVTSLFVFLVLLYVNVWFALIIGATLLLTLKGLLRYTRQKMNYYSQLRASAASGMNQQVLQGLAGIKEAKLYAKEPYFQEQFDQHARETNWADSFSTIFQQSPRYLIEAVTLTLVLGLTVVFVWLGYSGKEMLVLLSVFGIASVQLLPSLNRLMQALGRVRYALPALDTIYQELNHTYSGSQHDEVPAKTEDTKSVVFNHQLQLKALSYDYGEGNNVIRDINLSIDKGQKVAFVGETGAGKTTLVDVMMGLLWPTHGQIVVDGQPITRQLLPAWQSHFGYIPQAINLYNCSLRQNVAFGVPYEQIDDQQVWDCLRSACLTELVHSLPQGLDTVIGEHGIRLSGGQRQRVGIARALYHNPDILVMDEATAALDNQTEYEVTLALEQAAKWRTMITIAHRLSSIRNYDVIYVLHQGYVVAHGTYDELMQTSETFQEMVNTV